MKRPERTEKDNNLKVNSLKRIYLENFAWIFPHLRDMHNIFIHTIYENVHTHVLQRKKTFTTKKFNLYLKVYWITSDIHNFLEIFYIYSRNVFNAQYFFNFLKFLEMPWYTYLWIICNSNRLIQTRKKVTSFKLLKVALRYKSFWELWGYYSSSRNFMTFDLWFLYIFLLLCFQYNLWDICNILKSSGIYVFNLTFIGFTIYNLHAKL